ncbi:NAD(P)-dependent dehydrogenase (short-subunit alcohol dehydrogenase family) [Peribacillus deserti]|uniref:NAD(P)-dependent dehydrogenase (Short-subunit alcohol dehydrogenase family) n=1 Tax=Peribacillus deserti TaxID=673318 RepID=A0ABS2QE43_9BACI|nr:NAD(P)-dependent dehydrogenase (short-subunit alcohol dehydrogenase family) [Peribacillus deserti]
MTEQELQGKIMIITGANSGIGFEAAKALSNKGARVILAVRNELKGKESAGLILRENKDALVEVMRIDLSDLQSVGEFAETFSKRYNSLDILINNAGVMIPPYLKTKDGFELQFGSNHLGHFALTGLLLPLLKQTPDSRVVTLSSLAHKGAAIDFNNLQGENGYKAMKFYGQSKLANLLFSKELDHRLKQHHISTKSIACHPGITATNLFKLGQKDAPLFLKKLSALFLQPAHIEPFLPCMQQQMNN